MENGLLMIFLNLLVFGEATFVVYAFFLWFEMFRNKED